VCDAAADHSHERSISVTLHNRRVSITLVKIPVYGREDEDFALGEIIAAAVRKILEGGQWPNRNE
jgi:hypothetical protein